jgi:hypothetical protein
MGLLDDAIREHLELKRRRGGDATEISRQESDALGPVRRSPEGVPDLSDLPPFQDAAVDAEPGAAGVPEEPSPWEQEVHTPPAEPVYEPPPVPAAPAPPLPAAYESPAAPIADEPPGAADEPPADEPSHPSLLSRLNPAGRIRHARRDQADEPAAPEPPPLPAEPPMAAEELPPATHEPDVIPADEEPDGEELLEETPDFLEETPEHDRLWFEQRPPRDFNFDD